MIEVHNIAELLDYMQSSMMCPNHTEILFKDNVYIYDGGRPNFTNGSLLISNPLYPRTVWFVGEKDIEGNICVAAINGCIDEVSCIYIPASYREKVVLTLNGVDIEGFLE